MRSLPLLSLSAALLMSVATLPAFAQDAATPPAATEAVAPATTEIVPELDADGLDIGLRTRAAAMPAQTADGSEIISPASHIYLVDYATGAVLLDKAGREKMYPSSMTKMMTLLMVFDRLKQGTLSLENQFTVSEKAWRMQGSKMFVPLGGQIPLLELIRGISIQSGNDACITVAEGIAGSEEAFAKQMNDVAKQLGMTGSHFMDSSGWPHPDHYTTAHDLATLAMVLIRDYAAYYPYLSEREFTYNGIRQFNRNLLLNNTAMKVDGLKTGHTEAAGYGITLSAVDPMSGRRQVLVINGLPSEAERASEGERILLWGFRNFGNYRLFKAGQTLANVPVWLGKDRTLPLVVGTDVISTLPRTATAGIKAEVSFPSFVNAPVKQGDTIGKLTITLPSGATKEIPLQAGQGTEPVSFFGRIPRLLGL